MLPEAVTSIPVDLTGAIVEAALARTGFVVLASRLHPRLEQLAMAGRLRRAIVEENLRLHYQPLVDLKTGVIVGVVGNGIDPDRLTAQIAAG